MFYVFLVLCGAIGIGIYLVFILNLVPGAKEERLGVLEPLPPDVGKWKVDAESEQGRAASAEGFVREERLFFYETNGKLVRQVRYRDAKTNEIVRSDSEESVKRRRLRR